MVRLQLSRAAGQLKPLQVRASHLVTSLHLIFLGLSLPVPSSFFLFFFFSGENTLPILSLKLRNIIFIIYNDTMIYMYAINDIYIELGSLPAFPSQYYITQLSASLSWVTCKPSCLINEFKIWLKAEDHNQNHRSVLGMFCR